jgi:hypothetical protein
MFNGFEGINHPVKNLISGKGEITVSKGWKTQLIWKLRMFI